MRSMCFTVLTVTLLFLTGCGDFASNTTYQTLRDLNEGKKPELADIPQCQVDTAQYLLDTKLLTFEIKDKYGAGFGFSLLDGFFRALGLKLKMARGEMVVAMNVSQAIDPLNSVAYVKGIGESKEKEFSFTLDAIQLGLDLSYFHRTPLHKLMEKTFQNGLGNANAELDRHGVNWTSRVLHVDDEYQIIIPSGSVAGLRVGDKFNVFNVRPKWHGIPCESALLMEVKTSVAPIAVVEAIQVENHATLLQVIQMPDLEEPIRLGARVEILELPLKRKEKSRRLAKPVRIRSIESLPLELPNEQKLDLIPYSYEQLKILFSDHAMHPTM